jgi:hypothetical protein
MTLRTEQIKKEGYSLEAAEGIAEIHLRLTGTFDMTTTADLSLFLVSIEGEVKRLQTTELVINVVEVCYLGSSCIKSFVALVEAMKRLYTHPRTRILINPRLDWHERTFSILARLAPDQVILEKAK